MIATLRSLFFSALFYGVTMLLMLMVVLALLLPRLVTVWLARIWSEWHRFCVRAALGITIRVEGKLPEGQAFYALKHESFFEAIDLPTFLGGAPIPFAKIELLRLPLWGWAAARYGMIGVDRATGAKALRHMKKRASEARASGRDFAIFPEGTRVGHGEPAHLQAGLYAIYKVLDLPLVPVAVDSGPLYQAKPKRSGTITYRIGEVIPPGLPRADLEAKVSAAINALNDEGAMGSEP